MRAGRAQLDSGIDLDKVDRDETVFLGFRVWRLQTTEDSSIRLLAPAAGQHRLFALMIPMLILNIAVRPILFEFITSCAVRISRPAPPARRPSYAIG